MYSITWTTKPPTLVSVSVLNSLSNPKLKVRLKYYLDYKEIGRKKQKVRCKEV